MTVKSMVIDRRAFLGGAGAMAGAVVATSLVPFSVAHALPGKVPLSAAASTAEGNWHVDDVCGHWPPYAHPIGYGHATVTPAMVAHMDPVDHLFMA